MHFFLAVLAQALEGKPAELQLLQAGTSGFLMPFSLLCDHPQGQWGGGQAPGLAVALTVMEEQIGLPFPTGQVASVPSEARLWAQGPVGGPYMEPG